MNWKKTTLLLIGLYAIIKILLISDVFLSENRTLKLEEVNNAKYKASLYLRNFYIYKNEDATYHIKKFPEINFLDGKNQGRNVSPVDTWIINASRDLELESNKTIIPYDVTEILIFLKFNRFIIFEVNEDKNGKPVSLSYSILKDHKDYRKSKK